MKLSELTNKLTAILAEHGDKEITIWDYWDLYEGVPIEKLSVRDDQYIFNDTRNKEDPNLL